MPLSLSVNRPKSPITLQFSRSKSFSSSRKTKRSNTYPSPSTSTSTSSSDGAGESEPFDLSIILDQKNFDTLDLGSIKDVNNKEEDNQRGTRMQGGKIKFQLNENSPSKDRMTSKLIKNRKRSMVEGEDAEDSSKAGSENAQLLPSPLIHSTFPKSPYPFHGFNEPTPRDRRQSHRRSRSFSELITSSTSISQPWRDRETWLAIHTPKPSSGAQQRKGSIPIELEDGGWRARGGGTFFGADMNGPYPSLKVRVKPLSPPLSPAAQSQRHVSVRNPGKEDQVSSPTAKMSDANPVDKIIYQHKSQSAWNVTRPNTSNEELPSTRYYTPLPIEGNHNDDDDDFLPPLLPRTITRASSFSSSSRNTTPIPWAQRSGSNSPGRLTPPTTPSRQKTRNITPSSPLKQTPKQWTQVDPSPPRTSPRKMKAKTQTPTHTTPLINPRTPETPTRIARSPFGRRNTKDTAIGTPISPSERHAISVSGDHPDAEHHDRDEHVSPAKRLWKALKSVSPGKREEKKAASQGDESDSAQEMTAWIKRGGWF
ncbi:uncharacterized protein I303_104404 [Kwoniella dejecticola CBS 10117]|uniref:Uncharacterized protein n=1 Tax=Kwoniella dejecticola CBS 10117 TaxID=1296121 RepID=A0A1A6A5F5_9TREE|nr:uncharacterized protein I303_04617 [Kwoniella dejecticola CBS 10117]OBR85284.1 hypothetical protein I303_04617 [Kwoniella dejecticola CBS 10117]